MADDQPETTNTSRQPSTAALAFLISLSLLGLLLLGWIWFTRYAPVHFDIGRDATITDAQGAAFILPLILLGVFLIALAWLLLWIFARWQITLLPVAVGTIGVLALAFAGYQFWQSVNASQPITVTTYVCDADAAPIGGRAESIPAGCAPMTSTGMPTIGTSSDRTLVGPDSTEDATSTFTDLPQGIYDAVLTIDAPGDAASGALVVETDEGVRTVSPLLHAEGTSWAGSIALHPNLQDYAVLVYQSPYAAAPDAHIRFTVQECTGTSLANFDASVCDPASLTGPVVTEVPTDPAGRPATISIDTEGMTIANLEQREYTFTPVTLDRSLLRGRNDMLVIPSDGPQTRDRNLFQIDAGSPGGEFTVEVDQDTGTMEFIIYVFAEGPVIATTGDAPSTAMRPDVRP